MENFALIVSVLFVHFLAWLTPGPLFVLIIRNSLVFSRKTGLATAVGFALGNFIHIAVAVTGILLIISSSVLVFTAIKFLGVTYLIYLGVKTWRMKVTNTNTEIMSRQSDISIWAAIKIGFLTNILSIGAYLFFGSIFAGVLSTGAPRWVVAILFIAMPLNTLLMASILSIFFTQKYIHAGYTRFQPLLNKFLAVALFALAIMIGLNK